MPGGYAEFIDLDLEWTSPDGSLTENHASLKFNREFRKASSAANMEPCPGPLLEGYLNDAGFKNVVARKYVWPIGTWPADKHLVSGSILPPTPKLPEIPKGIAPLMIPSETDG